MANQEMGETRDSMGWAILQKAEEIANNMKSEREPFYIVFAGKTDKHTPNIIRQSYRIYKTKPEGILGILVWYVDHANGIFEFKPELSTPPDVPIDPAELSDKKDDFSVDIAEKAKKYGVIMS